MIGRAMAGCMTAPYNADHGVMGYRCETLALIHLYGFSVLTNGSRDTKTFADF